MAVALACLLLLSALSPAAEPQDSLKDKVAEIKLEKGWNLVSLPAGGEIVINDCPEKLAGYAYVPYIERYISVSSMSDLIGRSSINSYLSRHAFWVYSHRQCGIVFKVSNVPQDVWLSRGWNLVPVTPGMAGRSVGDVLGSCETGEASFWDAETQRWGDLEQITEQHVYGGFAVISEGSCRLQASETLK